MLNACVRGSLQYGYLDFAAIMQENGRKVKTDLSEWHRILFFRINFQYG